MTIGFYLLLVALIAAGVVVDNIEHQDDVASIEQEGDGDGAQDEAEERAEPTEAQRQAQGGPP